MSTIPEASESRRHEAREAVAGLLATAAIFTSLLGVAYRPVRLIPVAVVLALVAARMTTRYSRLAGFAIAAVVVCWILGMAIAVITENPLY
ncbi:MAG: hypothetical protein H0T61_06185 [Actinobacteria bacterium]|nr:hypothetical protein [Actinomycetota bacterium]